MTFEAFAFDIHKRFSQLARGELFTVDLTGQEVWDEYLAAFPPGSNDLMRERSEHDCSACKQFIRSVGNVVTILDNQLHSIWAIEPRDTIESHYAVVAHKLNALVTSRPIAGLFRTKEPSYGCVYNIESVPGGTPRVWNHLHTGPLPARLVTKDADAERGRYAESAAMFARALSSLKRGALDEILGLINDKLLYRGEEHRDAVGGFRIAQAKYYDLPAEQRPIYVWNHACDLQNSRFRNTVIGTLAVDLSEGVALEEAVRSFESKVAPQNYKRTSALITPSMVEAAEEKVKELGLLPALGRRFAKLSDISVADVLWVDGAKRDVMKNVNPFTSLRKSVDTKPKGVVPDDLPIEQFMRDILPATKTMELLVKNHQQHNFVSLTAPLEQHHERFFKWMNGFAWSYAGNVTDSIKERVKRAGGKTGVPLRVSLAWFNKDDLDLHSQSPHGHVFFGAKEGILDVDMNAGGGTTREPVENQSWKHPKDGTYKIVVNQYNQRETIDTGFTLEMECNGGELMQWHYAKPVKGQLQVLEFVVKAGVVSKITALKDLKEGSTSRERWGIATETFVKVNSVMYSPNYWGDQAVGNKHVIFALDGCVNDEPTRGFYNEYLHGSLEPHRKVFEVLGAKTLCPPSRDQVSGLGFSSTRGDTVVLRADKRTYLVVF